MRKKRFEIYTHIRNILSPITEGILLHPPSQSTVELGWLKICRAGRLYTLRWIIALQSNEQGKRLPLFQEKLELSKLAALKAVNLKINNNESYLFTKWDIMGHEKTLKLKNNNNSMGSNRIGYCTSTHSDNTAQGGHTN